MAGKNSKSGAKLDLATLGGVALAMLGLLGGLLLEGGKLRDVAQITAALIVVGGTLGAVMVSTPMPVLMAASKSFMQVLFDSTQPPDAVIEEMIGYATKARKSGLVSLEQEALAIKDPFLRKSLNLAVDGTDIQELRAMMELEMEIEETRAHAQAKVFESAGGYSPTVGIIGAVMGLIQVMKNLANIEEVGHGIAVAFVATIYGVALANIFFIPAANKIKARIQGQTQLHQLMLEGVLGIIEGLNPKLLRTKLDAYRLPASPKKSKAAAETAPKSETLAAENG